VLALLLLGCPQLLDDSFGTVGGEGGELASAGSGDSPAGGSGGSAGTSSSGGASGGTGVGGTQTGGGASGGAGSGSGGARTGGSGGSAGTAAGTAGSGGTTSPTGCTLTDFSEPELIAGLGRSDALYGPSLASNGFLAFSESIDDGPEDIYLSQRSSPDGPFGVALPAAGINTAGWEGTAFLTSNALTLYFYSDRSGGAGGRDLYRATRSNTLADFGDVSHLEGVNGGADDHMPWLSPDERTIYFASNRPAIGGDTNLWVAHRNGVLDGFDPPLEVAGVNSVERDISPALSSDQLILFFCSDREGGPGSDDIWMATRDDPESDFGPPEPVPIINSTWSELNVTSSSDGREIIFSSNRDGTRKLYRSVRGCL
jgi:hypothetical protein